MAANVGVLRHLAAIKEGREDRYGHEGIGWNLHIEGACGELVTCKYKNWYWSGSVNTFKKKADIGDWIEVRTRSRHDYDLIVRPDDRPDRFYVLVTGIAPDYRIHGFIDGIAARQPHWLKDYGDRPDAWFVPKEALASIDDLTLDPPSSVRLTEAA